MGQAGQGSGEGCGEGEVMKLKLLTAILMTMATLAWIASALLSPGEGALFRWSVVVIFAILAVFYWRAYFRMKNAQTPNSDISGTE